MGKDPACSVCRATPSDCWQCLVRRRNDRERGVMNWHYVCNILTGELLYSGSERQFNPVTWPLIQRSIDFYPDPLVYFWDEGICAYQKRPGADPEKSKHFFIDEDGDGL